MPLDLLLGLLSLSRRFYPKQLGFISVINAPGQGGRAEEPLMFISRVVNGLQSAEQRSIPNAGSPPRPPSSGAPARARPEAASVVQL